MYHKTLHCKVPYLLATPQTMLPLHKLPHLSACIAPQGYVIDTRGQMANVYCLFVSDHRLLQKLMANGIGDGQCGKLLVAGLYGQHTSCGVGEKDYMLLNTNSGYTGYGTALSVVYRIGE